MLVSLQNGGQKLSGRASKRFVPIAESCFRVGLTYRISYYIGNI